MEVIKYISKDVHENIISEYINGDKTYWRNEFNKTLFMLEVDMELNKCILCKKALIAYRYNFNLYGGDFSYIGHRNGIREYDILFGCSREETNFYIKKYGKSNHHLYFFHIECEKEHYKKTGNDIR